MAEYAKVCAHETRTLVLPMVRRCEPCKWSSLRVETPIWHACLAQISLIPPNDLPSLQRTYTTLAFVEQISDVVKKQFEEWAARTPAEVPKNLIGNLERLAKRCDEIVELGDTFASAGERR